MVTELSSDAFRLPSPIGSVIVITGELVSMVSCLVPVEELPAESVPVARIVYVPFAKVVVTFADHTPPEDTVAVKL